MDKHSEGASIDREAKKDTLMYKDLVLLPYAERVTALQYIAPGEWVAIAPFHDPVINFYNREEYSQMRSAINLAREIEEERRLLMFHSRKPDKQVQLVARGVDPRVYVQLADALKRIKIPAPKMPQLVF
jgi:hypothetical protein